MAETPENWRQRSHCVYKQEAESGECVTHLIVLLSFVCVCVLRFFIIILLLDFLILESSICNTYAYIYTDYFVYLYTFCV